MLGDKVGGLERLAALPGTTPLAVSSSAGLTTSADEAPPRPRFETFSEGFSSWTLLGGEDKPFADPYCATLAREILGKGTDQTDEAILVDQFLVDR
jgi:hypothetical protein